MFIQKTEGVLVFRSNISNWFWSYYFLTEKNKKPKLGYEIDWKPRKSH